METERVTGRARPRAASVAVALSALMVAWVVSALSGCASRASRSAARAEVEQVGDRAPEPRARLEQERYEYPETRQLVALVNEAVELVERDGEAAFGALRTPNSRWRRGETYVFVLDTEGNMLVHADPALEGKNQLALQDVNGRPIVRGLIEAATSRPEEPRGWYHYQWPVPGGLLPRWKSSYVRLVVVPNGQRLIVGSGAYDDRMERAFVVDMVEDATAQVERLGQAAFPLFRDPTGRFMAKDAYVFVIDPAGTELVNPAFPNLEGRDLTGLRDAGGKPLVRDMLALVESRGSGWVDYMWPKPGESVSTRKSTYVSTARVGEKWLLVGAGVYLADAPQAAPTTGKMSPPELMALVHDAAALLEQHGEDSYPELRLRDSKWFNDDTYFFVWTMDGTRAFHAADPSLEGKPGSDAKDVLGRPYGKMFLEVAAGRAGQGWVHYMYPEPGSLFPVWKSTFLRRVRFPSGQQYLVGAGIYNMQMDEAFIEDVVDRAAALVADRGQGAFDELRDKTGPFRFMDVYVFVDTPDGVELVNPGQPSLEGMNIIDLRDVKGKAVAREYIDAALKQRDAWVEYYWYKPGENTPARKLAYVRKVRSGKDTYIVGSGVYLED